MYDGLQSATCPSPGAMLVRRLCAHAYLRFALPAGPKDSSAGLTPSAWLQCYVCVIAFSWLSCPARRSPSGIKKFPLFFPGLFVSVACPGLLPSSAKVLTLQSTTAAGQCQSTVLCRGGAGRALVGWARGRRRILFCG